MTAARISIACSYALVSWSPPHQARAQVLRFGEGGNTFLGGKDFCNVGLKQNFLGTTKFWGSLPPNAPCLATGLISTAVRKCIPV